jgi:hypothetical protein
MGHLPETPEAGPRRRGRNRRLRSGRQSGSHSKTGVRDVPVRSSMPAWRISA